VLSCGVECNAVVHCGVVWCGVVYCSVVFRTALYYAELLCGVVWCGVEWYAVLWCGAVCWLRCGVVGLTVVWCGVVWCGVVSLNASTTKFYPESLTAAYYCRVRYILIRQARSTSMPYCDVFFYAYSFIAMLLLAGIFHHSILRR
jgi:hypothetical protein